MVEVYKNCPYCGFPLAWVQELDPPRWVCMNCMSEFYPKARKTSDNGWEERRLENGREAL